MAGDQVEGRREGGMDPILIMLKGISREDPTGS